MNSQVFRFLNQKCESYFLQRLKPSKLDWTVVFRRLHKKGLTEAVSKKRVKRSVKVTRAVAGTTVDSMKALRNQKPQERLAARAKALAGTKSAKKELESKKKAEKVKVVKLLGNQGINVFIF